MNPTTPLRDDKYVLTLAYVASIRLKAEVSVLQGDRFTEWRLGDRGFAVGPCPTSYPPKGLLEVIITKLSPPIPAQKLKRTDDEDDSQVGTKSGNGIRGRSSRGR